MVEVPHAGFVIYFLKISCIFRYLPFLCSLCRSKLKSLSHFGNVFTSREGD